MCEHPQTLLMMKNESQGQCTDCHGMQFYTSYLNLLDKTDGNYGKALLLKCQIYTAIQKLEVSRILKTFFGLKCFMLTIAAVVWKNNKVKLQYYELRI